MFERNEKWNEMENVRGQGLSLIKVIEKGLEFTTRRKLSAEKNCQGQNMLEKKIVDIDFDTNDRKTVTNTVELTVIPTTTVNGKILTVEEDLKTSKKILGARKKVYNLEDIEKEEIVRKRRKLFEKKEDSIRKTVLKKIRNPSTKKTPASEKKKVALRSAALLEMKDQERLEDRVKSTERSSLRSEDLRQSSITASTMKIGRRLFESWKDEISLVEGASPPPSNGTNYGWGKIGSEQVVLTGRKPLCGKARPDDPIGSRLVTEVGGEAHPGTGQGVGSVLGPYGWSMPGCHTIPRPNQALGRGGLLELRPRGGGTAGLGGEVPHGTSRGEGAGYTSCTDRKKAGD